MIFTTVDPGSWETEQSRGSWCFAATTKALRGHIKGDGRSQAEIAHDFCIAVSDMGGGSVYGGSRGKDIDNYLDGIRQKPGAEHIQASWVDTWVSQGTLTPDPRPLLRKVWGEVDYKDLKNEWVKADTEEATRQQIARTLERGGLVVVGTANHNMLIYGYEIPDDAEPGYVVDEFWVWDPTNGSTKQMYIGDLEGNQLVLVEP